MPETTAIIGIGNIGSALARSLVHSGEAVILAADHESRAEELARELGPLARATSVEDAIADADVVVLALWLDTIKELVAKDATLLDGKIVVDPSNPLGFDGDGQILRTLPEGESAGESSWWRQLERSAPWRPISRPSSCTSCRVSRCCWHTRSCSPRSTAS